MTITYVGKVGKALVISQLAITPDTPLEKRLETLNPFFSPNFGNVAFFDPSELKDLRAKKRQDVQGYIRVNPPKGSSFTITRKQATHDYVVSSPAPIPFDISDLNEQGTFTWIVRTDKTDFGTPLQWQTPYRIARIVTDTMTWPGRPDMQVIERCEASKTSLGERRIYVTFLNGETWAVAFPPKDTLVPQPPSLPKLFIRGFRGKGFARSERIYGKAQEPVEKLPEGIVWQMNPHKSYEMAGKYFIGSDNHPPGALGKCRYLYYEKEVDAGLLECHEVVGFHWVYLPLTCLPSISPPSPSTNTRERGGWGGEGTVAPPR